MNKFNKIIYLAGGCFWGMEGYFRRLKGVLNTEVGYANGRTENTSYKELKFTGHAEAILVEYNSFIISLEELLLRFFSVIDPLSINRQGNDIGEQYRTGIFYIDEESKAIINKVMAYKTDVFGQKPAVIVEKLAHFILAEDYHQDYLEKNPTGYCHIDINRAYKSFDNKEYTLPNEDEIKSRVSALAYEVTRNKATEKPFSSEFYKFNKDGIYVDILTGQPLFSSRDKFDVGCGWPSFSRPIVTDALNYYEDLSHNMNRVEVTSTSGEDHLGHVFNDGIKEMGGLRFCINGAALRFIPYENMDNEGYGLYKIFVK